MGYKSKFEPAPFGTTSTSSIDGDLYVDGSIYVTKDFSLVSASYYVGDGSGLTGITASATGTWQPAGGGDIFYNGGDAALGKTSPDSGVTFDVVGVIHNTSNTKFGSIPSNTHILTGSLFVSGSNKAPIFLDQNTASFHTPYFSVVTSPLLDMTALSIREAPGGSEPRSPQFVVGKDADTLINSMYQHGNTLFVEDMDAYASDNIHGVQIWYSGSADATMSGAYVSLLHMPRTAGDYGYNGGMKLMFIPSMDNPQVNASCSWAPNTGISAGRLDVNGTLHFCAGNPWGDTATSALMAVTSSMLLYQNAGLFVGRPYLTSKAESQAMGPGSLIASGSTKFGKLLTDTHQVTGSWHMTGTSGSFNVDEFRIDMFSPDNPTWGTYPGMVIDLKARPDHGHAPRIIFGGEPEDLPYTAYGSVTIMEKESLAQESNPYVGLQIMFSGSEEDNERMLFGQLIHFPTYPGSSGGNIIQLAGYPGVAALQASCSWAPDVQYNSMRISPHTIGDLHFGGNEGWYTDGRPLHGTSSMILHSSVGGAGSLFVGRPWDGARLETLGLGSGSLFVSGSTNFGTLSTDTHEITGTLSLSGSSGAGFGTEGALLELEGLNSTIKGHVTDGSGRGHLHMYCDHNLYLGCRGVDQIAIGRPLPDVDFSTETPIYIHTANRTIAISGSMAYKSRQSFLTFGTASSNVQIIGVNSTGGTPFGIELPSATSSAGQVLIVKDEGGQCATTNITVNGASAETIDGESSIALDNNYESLNLYSDGSNWFIW